MKKIITVATLLFPVFLLNGCASNCNIFSTDPACEALLVGGVILTAPVMVPYVVAKNANDAHKSKMYVKENTNTYQKYIKGVASDDYEQIKQCVLYCGEAKYTYLDTLYDPQLQEVASRKLLDHPTTCMTNEEYPIYLSAYLNLIGKQDKANQAVDEALTDKAWQLYQSTAKIAYDPQKNSQCTSPANTNISQSIQAQIKKSALDKPIQYLKADLFNRPLKNMTKKEIDQRFTRCPQLAPKDQYDDPYDVQLICEAAYKQYTAAGNKLDQPIDGYEKIWREWRITKSKMKSNTPIRKTKRVAAQ